MNSSISLSFLPAQLPLNINKLYVAFSGGIDSTVLMHVLLPYKQQFQVVLWHINHGLQQNAQTMEDFARSQADQFGFEFCLDRLKMDPSEGNLEAKARDHRYQLFEQALTENDVLLTAHHKNDQAETLLLNLMRGSGAAGLRAIARLKPLGKGLLMRPLIDFTRLQIEQYAAHHKLDWKEDPSNKKTDFDRNYVRHKVLPVLLERWPSTISQLQRVSELQNESEQLHSDLAKIDYINAKINRSFTEYSCLSVKVLHSLSFARQKNIIRYWIKQHSFPVLGFHKIEELVRQLNSRIDALPIIEGKSYQVRLYKQVLYIVDLVDQFRVEASYKVPDCGPLNIPQVHFCQSRIDIFDNLKRQDNGENILLKFRQSSQHGITFPHAHTLKRLFQKHQVPPWKRPFIPQVFLNDELAGLWIE